MCGRLLIIIICNACFILTDAVTVVLYNMMKTFNAMTDIPVGQVSIV